MMCVCVCVSCSRLLCGITKYFLPVNFKKEFFFFLEKRENLGGISYQHAVELETEVIFAL